MCRVISRTATQRLLSAIACQIAFRIGVFALLLARDINSLSAIEAEQYLKVIKPLLTEKCISCHGALRAEAGLRLDAIQLIRSGSTNEASSAADESTGSKLLARITSLDKEFRMPPEDAGSPLTDKQIELLSAWKSASFPGPSEESFLASPRDHWAYQPIVKPALGDLKEVNAASPIDRMITTANDARGVRPLSKASESVWLRRVTFDVTGLPPTVDELNDFLADSSPDKNQKVIDRLLSEPSYGERWGRHWMDVWRYSDWDGYKEELRTSQRHIWHWRDWIVESLNSNKPYDQMVLEMLAADEVSPENQQSLRATGFLARNFHKSNRNIWLDATVEHTAKAFLGMTLNCAKCHDHKYDPLPQQAYYQFRALFEPHKIRTDQILGESRIEKDGIPRAFDENLQAETYVYFRGDDKKPLKDSPVRASVPDFFPIPFEIVPIPLPVGSYYPELSDRVRQNVIAAKVEAEKSALAALNTKVKLLNEGTDKTIATQFDETFYVDLDLAISKLRVAQTDRTSTQARYTAESKKYELEMKALPPSASRSNPVIGPISNTDGNDWGQQASPKPLLYSVRKSFDANRPGNLWIEWLALARRAADLEYSHKYAVAKYDVLVKERAFRAVMLSSEKETDKKKRDASIQSAKEELKKSQSTLDQLAMKRDVHSTKYTPIGKELPRSSSGRRTALAKWIIHADNPLTARVAINHIWMRHFGTPLVENTFDFGMSSPEPELLELLNWLSAELIESNWDMKHIHRLILASEVYARSSDEPDNALYQANVKLDPENATYWRANTRRLDAEEIRDSMLTVSKQLDRQRGGPDIHFTDGEKVMRRSLYFRHAYEKQMPMLVMFDAASPNECYRRKPSLVPQQALALANSSLARDLAHHFADNCFTGQNEDSSLDEKTNGEFIDMIFLTALCRQPTDEESTACLAFLHSQAELLKSPEQLTRFEEKANATEDKLSSAAKARRSLAIVVFNHHDFVTIR